MSLEWRELAVEAEIFLSGYVCSASYFKRLRILNTLERNTIIFIFSTLSYIFLFLPISLGKLCIEPIFLDIFRNFL